MQKLKTSSFKAKPCMQTMGLRDLCLRVAVEIPSDRWTTCWTTHRTNKRLLSIENTNVTLTPSTATSPEIIGSRCQGVTTESLACRCNQTARNRIMAITAITSLVRTTTNVSILGNICHTTTNAASFTRWGLWREEKTGAPKGARGNCGQRTLATTKGGKTTRRSEEATHLLRIISSSSSVRNA